MYHTVLNLLIDQILEILKIQEKKISGLEKRIVELELNKQVKNAVATAEDNLDQYWNKELDKQIEEAMAKFHLKKGVKYDVKASDSVIVITPTNKIKERANERL